jgi:hypothetical protein
MVLKENGKDVWLVVYYPEPHAAFSDSAVFGDFLYNLRSSLDALIYALVQRNDGVPTRITSFPIYSDPAEYELRIQPNKKTDALAGLPAEARAVVKSLQPFMRGKPSQDLDPLHQLNEMCNQDKHRTSHIILGFATEAHFALHLGEGRVVNFSSDGPLIGHGPWLIPIPAVPSDLKPNHRIEAGGGADFLIRSDAPWQGRPVLDFSRACLQYVEEKVIRVFMPFFG